MHTQFGRDIPWSEIDMDFMNLNQSAHGGREFGFICSRLRKNRGIVVGHWEDPVVREELGVWTRAALGWNEAQNLKIARFGDNMRQVAVTEGDKVEAQIKFGYEVNGYAMGDLRAYVDKVTEEQIDVVVAEYAELYDIHGDATEANVREQARIEIGLRAFLENGGFKASPPPLKPLWLQAAARPGRTAPDGRRLRFRRRRRLEKPPPWFAS